MTKENAHLTKQLERKVQDIQTPIATIEMCLHLLSEEIQNDKLLTIRTALQKVRDISKQFLCIAQK